MKLRIPSEGDRYELHMAVGRADVYWDDKGRLLANLPDEAPPAVVEARGKEGGVMPVSWIAYNRPRKDGERRLLTVKVNGFRSPEIDAGYLQSHPDARRLEPFDPEAELVRARRSIAMRIHSRKADPTGQNVGFTHLVWPGTNVDIDPARPTLFSQPWSTSDLPSDGPLGRDHVMVVEAHWKSIEQPYILVEDRQGNQTKVDPLDLIEDLHGTKLGRWRSNQVNEQTEDLQGNIKSILNLLCPDLDAGHGRAWVDESGVFLPWEAIKAILIDGHEVAGEALGKLAEAALTIEHERSLVP